jgi:hypothetical protein
MPSTPENKTAPRDPMPIIKGVIRRYLSGADIMMGEHVDAAHAVVAELRVAGFEIVEAADAPK